MSREAEERMEPLLDAVPVPSLETAMDVWYAARRRFKREPGRENLNDYNLATDLLAQAFKRDYAEGSEVQMAFEQFRRGLIEQERD